MLEIRLHHVFDDQPEQGRLHPADLQLIKEIVQQTIRRELVTIMAQIDQLLDDLNAITTDVANEVTAHIAEVQQLEATITDLQAQIAANQPVDLGPALELTRSLREKLENTAATATDASNSAQTAVDAAGGSAPVSSDDGSDDGSDSAPPADSADASDATAAASDSGSSSQSTEGGAPAQP
jgi:paraquat-inducible protein B